MILLNNITNQQALITTGSVITENPQFVLTKLDGIYVEVCIRQVVGATGFEPATARPPGVCATRLRYAPTLLNIMEYTFSKRVKFFENLHSRCFQKLIQKIFLSYKIRPCTYCDQYTLVIMQFHSGYRNFIPCTQGSSGCNKIFS